MDTSILLLIAFLFLAFWTLAIIDLIRGKLKLSEKIMWMFLFLLFPFLGIIVYYNFGKRIAERRGRFQPFRR